MTIHTALRLQEPNAAQRDAFMRLLTEYEQAGERFRHGRIHERARRDFQRFVAELRAHARGEGLRPGWVPHTMYWLMAGQEIAGETTLRHHLTPDLYDEGGHIGYRITPSFRRRGYGTRLLTLMLEKARAAGLPRVLVTCDSDNVGSAKIIQANGGVFENEVRSPHSGKPVSRFWVTLHPRLSTIDVAVEARAFHELTHFVTRGDSLLLLERHGRIALPTGFVNRTEQVSNAAWRSVYEQTGLVRLQLVDILAQRQTLLDQSLRFVLATSGLTHVPNGRTMSGRLRRGTPVSILATQGPYAQVTHNDFVVDDQGRQRLRARISGWLPAQLLAKTHTRHFIQLENKEEGPLGWHRRTAEERLRLFWAPLASLPLLPRQHERWVNEFQDRLARGSADS